MRIEITTTGAIYANDHRITDRSTKALGGAATKDSFHCAREMLHDTLRDRGHATLIDKIDAEPFK